MSSRPHSSVIFPPVLPPIYLVSSRSSHRLGSTATGPIIFQDGGNLFLELSHAAANLNLQRAVQFSAFKLGLASRLVKTSADTLFTAVQVNPGSAFGGGARRLYKLESKIYDGKQLRYEYLNIFFSLFYGTSLQLPGLQTANEYCLCDSSVLLNEILEKLDEFHRHVAGQKEGLWLLNLLINEQRTKHERSIAEKLRRILSLIGVQNVTFNPNDPEVPPGWAMSGDVLRNEMQKLGTALEKPPLLQEKRLVGFKMQTTRISALVYLYYLL